MTPAEAILQADSLPDVAAKGHGAIAALCVLASEVRRLHAECESLRQAKADALDARHAALRLVAELRWALGDDGKRMQPELIEYAKTLRPRSKERFELPLEMDDRVLLEAAAKAAGLSIEYWAQDDYPVVRNGDKKAGWNPLVFDSDALRLAVRLSMNLYLSDCGEIHVDGEEPLIEAFGMGDPLAATRRAITRAAAAMARAAGG